MRPGDHRGRWRRCPKAKLSGTADVLLTASTDSLFQQMASTEDHPPPLECLQGEAASGTTACKGSNTSAGDRQGPMQRATDPLSYECCAQGSHVFHPVRAPRSALASSTDRHGRVFLLCDVTALGEHTGLRNPAQHPRDPVVKGQYEDLYVVTCQTPIDRAPKGALERARSCAWCGGAGSQVKSSQVTLGMLHAGVDQKRLKCNIFKTLFRSVRLERVEADASARSAETTATSDVAET